MSDKPIFIAICPECGVLAECPKCGREVSGRDKLDRWITTTLKDVAICKGRLNLIEMGLGGLLLAVRREMKVKEGEG